MGISIIENRSSRKITHVYKISGFFRQAQRRTYIQEVDVAANGAEIEDDSKPLQQG